MVEGRHTEYAQKISRGMQLALFLVATAWAAAANTLAALVAQGLAVRYGWEPERQLIEGALFLSLAAVGFAALDWIATRGVHAAEVLSLPSRPGFFNEWGLGVALGWGVCLFAALPIFLTGHLHAGFAWNRGIAGSSAVALLTLLVACLATEVVFRGYPFRRLSAAVGPAWAAVLLSAGAAALTVGANPPHHLLLALSATTLFSLMLAIAWLRTHALWLGWGLHFAYRAVGAVVLGMPVAGHGNFGSPTDMDAGGPRWLSGGAFGLDAALLTSLVMLAGIVVLYRVTRELAWRYTHAPIVAAGYEVTVAPPAAHAAMEAAAPPPPLVQILPQTSQSWTAVDPRTAPPPPPLPVGPPAES